MEDLSALWRRVGLGSVAAAPEFEGVEDAVGKLHLRLGGLRPLFDSRLLDFVRGALLIGPYGAVRFSVDIAVDAATLDCPDRSGLENELTRFFAPHWSAAGFFGVLDRDEGGEPLTIYLYGRSLLQPALMEQVVGRLAQRGIDRLAIIVDLDEEALNGGY